MCVIEWESKGVISSVEYGVSKCQVECLKTNGNFRYDIMFAKKFQPEQNGGWCSCIANGKEVAKFFGPCEEGSPSPGARCFQDWTRQRTNSYSRDQGRKTWTVKTNPSLYGPNTYEYECTPNGCPEGNCDKVNLAGMTEGFNEEEQEFVTTVLHKMRRGEKLSKEERNMAETLPEDDIESVLFNELLRLNGGSLNVDKLRAHYEEKLSGFGVSVGHMLTVADMNDGDEEVDLAKFKKFLKPRC